ncbi:hypothetical protein BDV41DRAFT_543230 [Aspergillus transmontanensis]|nr:hypothetical protein BDV41DRAFT_543230 [Aspergillus transmontanensis]
MREIYSLPLLFKMSDHKINLIREIGWHRANIRFYRAHYTLLKELQDVAQQVADDLLSYCYNSSRQEHRTHVTDIATRAHQTLDSLIHRECEAYNAWNELWDNEPVKEMA